MTKIKRTAWFPASVKPVRPGWYEVVFDGHETVTDLRYYSVALDRWSLSRTGVISVFGWGLEAGADQWRGLTEKA